MQLWVSERVDRGKAAHKVFAYEVRSPVGDQPEAAAPMLGEVQESRSGGPTWEVAH